MFLQVLQLTTQTGSEQYFPSEGCTYHSHYRFSVKVWSGSQLWLLKKPSHYRQVCSYFDFFIYTLRRFQQFSYSSKISHDCFELTVMSSSNRKHRLHLKTSWELVLMCTVQSSPQKVSFPPSFPSLQAQFYFNYPRQQRDQVIIKSFLKSHGNNPCIYIISNVRT